MPGCEPGEFIVTCLWNSLLVHPLINLLVLADYFVHDFGLAVVIVTVAIRLALFPVFRAQVRSSRAMQELAPALNDIKKKHGNDRARLQQEQMKLYQERGINPIGGCLPMLVFFPVLFAMYAAFQQVGGLTGAHALTIQELRDKVLWPFIPTPPELEPDATIDLTAHWLPWISNLAKPDHVVILPLIGGIGPLPIISAALQLVASIQALPRKPAQTDDPTQRTMQSMTYYLPLITIVFFKDLAAGVFIYYITTTIFQLVQQYFVMGWGQLPRFIPALDNIPTPADATMRARESAAIKEAEDDMKSAEREEVGAGRREQSGTRGRRRRRKR
jgi:YidC/Oxa1 family membrane protein insertase